MKKNIFLLALPILTLTASWQGVFAAEDSTVVNTNSWVVVSELVPGANCYCIKDHPTLTGAYTPETTNITWAPWKNANTKVCNTPVQKRKYFCEIKPGMSGFQEMFRSIVQWIIAIWVLLGVLAIVALGIAWSFAGGENPEYKKFLKEWVMGVFIGLIILFLFGYILMFLAPWIFTYKIYLLIFS